MDPTQVHIDCYVFPLGIVDVILGIAWLETLGEVCSYWAKSNMKFKQGGQWITLCGDPTLVRSTISVNSLNKMGDINFCAFICLAEISGTIDKAGNNLNEQQ